MTKLEVLATGERWRAQVERLGLEDVVAEIERFGKPGISKLPTGWWCRVDMYITGKGREFKVDSECRHDTPLAAARECLLRMLEALDDLGVDPERLRG